MFKPGDLVRTFNPGDLVRTVTDDTTYNGMGVVVYSKGINQDYFQITLQGYDYTLPFDYNEIILLQPNS
jgi:hypothetical protein